jgi:hypothetical protein
MDVQNVMAAMIVMNVIGAPPFKKNVSKMDLKNTPTTPQRGVQDVRCKKCNTLL